MKKVLVEHALTEKQKQQFLALSDKYEFVFGTEDKDAQIAVGNFSPAQIKELKNLELYISAWVGYDAFIKKGVLKNSTLLVNAVDVHTEEVAEHMFVLMLSMVKNLHLYRDNQADHKWKDEGKVKSISELTVAILGLGHIGNLLAKYCKALGMYVIGVKRTIDQKPDYVDELLPIGDLDEILPRVDVVLSVLPSSEQTKHMFTLDRFKLMKRDAILINAGRGDLIEPNLLCDVLDQGIISGVGQDVFEKEPIDENSRLWTTKRLAVTPHVAGFFHLDIASQKFVDLAVENLKRYANNEELKYVVTEREQ